MSVIISENNCLEGNLENFKRLNAFCFIYMRYLNSYMSDNVYINIFYGGFCNVIFQQVQFRIYFITWQKATPLYFCTWRKKYLVFQSFATLTFHRRHQSCNLKFLTIHIAGPPPPPPPYPHFEIFKYVSNIFPPCI